MTLGMVLVLLVCLPAIKTHIIQNDGLRTLVAKIQDEQDETVHFAVNSGYPVTFSSAFPSFDHVSNARLNANDYAWAAAKAPDQWIQVSSIVPVKWIGVLTQGRGYCCDQWVTSYTVSYSNDGITWFYVDNMKNFSGNYDMNTIVKNTFRKPVVASTIRINPISWYGWITMRFDAIFLR